MAKSKGGRPPKLSFAEKQKIVDSFFRLRAGSDPNKLKAYNIFAQLAAYADEVDWRDRNGQVLRAKDFSDDQTKAYIDDLSRLADGVMDVDGNSMPVYTSIDMYVLQSMPKEEIVRIVRQREDYYQSVCIEAAKTFKRCIALQTETNLHRNDSNTAKRELQEAVERNEALARNIENLMRRNKALVSLCRALGDKNTQEYFADMPMKGLGVAKYKELAQIPVGQVACHDGIPNDDIYDDIEEWSYDG